MPDQPLPPFTQRVIRAFPPCPEGLLLLVYALLLLAMGATLGLLWCGTHWSQPPPFQQQLDALDGRVRALESR